MLSNFFQGVVNKRVDERINEILQSGETFEFKNVPDPVAAEEMSSFIIRKREDGITKLSTLDFVLNLRLPAEQVEKVLDKFEKEKKVKEVAELYV